MYIKTAWFTLNVGSVSLEWGGCR
eukprot:COSAG02_NODE_67349_length_253_cov_0.668831_1_plen_23_part_10